MGAVKATSIISHWNHMTGGITQSSNEFYGEVERGLAVHNLKDAKLERVNMSEGGIFSSKREYLQVRRGDLVFHVCAAPFGNGFFISWWLGEIESGLLAALAEIPYLGGIVGLFRNVTKPRTYYKVDTALMFQAVTHDAVLGALDAVINAKGVRALSETERTPVMRDLFRRLA